MVIKKFNQSSASKHCLYFIRLCGDTAQSTVGHQTFDKQNQKIEVGICKSDGQFLLLFLAIISFAFCCVTVHRVWWVWSLRFYALPHSPFGHLYCF